MKYAVRDSYFWFDTHEYIDHFTTAWVRNYFYDKKLSRAQRVMHTEFLSDALLFDNPMEAARIANDISTPECPARMVQVTEKDIFKAKLGQK